MIEQFTTPGAVEEVGAIGELSETQLESISSLMPEDISNLEMTPEFAEDLVDQFDLGIKCMHADWRTPVNLSILHGRSPVWDEFLTRVSPEYLAAPVDKIQWNEIGEVLCNVEELKIEKWKSLSLEERLDVLQRIENSVAAIEHRPACEVKMHKLSGANGCFSEDVGITINTDRMQNSADSQESLDKLIGTLIHEGRHAYQFYNISTRMVHSSAAQVEEWAKNWPNYFDGHSIEIAGQHVRTNFLRETGIRLYYYQPVEADARTFAADTISHFKAIRNY